MQPRWLQRLRQVLIATEVEQAGICIVLLQVVELYKDITAAFEELANEPEAPKPQTPLNSE